jgi:hypothetical protein
LSAASRFQESKEARRNVIQKAKSLLGITLSLPQAIFNLPSMHALDVAFGLNLVYVEKLNGCVTKYNMAWLSKTFQKGNGPESKPAVPKGCSRASILSLMLKLRLRYRY